MAQTDTSAQRTGWRPTTTSTRRSPSQRVPPAPALVQLAPRPSVADRGGRRRARDHRRAGKRRDAADVVEVGVGDGQMDVAVAACHDAGSGLSVREDGGVAHQTVLARRTSTESVAHSRLWSTSAPPSSRSTLRAGIWPHRPTTRSRSRMRVVHPMFDEHVRHLLDRPGLLGVVCTCRADGSPQANPVWFRLDDSDHIRIWTDDARHWIANLRRAPEVAFSVHEARRPWMWSRSEGVRSLGRSPLTRPVPRSVGSQHAIWRRTNSTPTSTRGRRRARSRFTRCGVRGPGVRGSCGSPALVRPAD